MNTETMASNIISLKESYIQQWDGGRHKSMVEADATCSLIYPIT